MPCVSRRYYRISLLTTVRPRTLVRNAIATGGASTRDDVIIGTQGNALPEALVKIEDGPGFAGKGRIAREDPASMFPGAKGIAAEPAPQSSAADLSDQALRNNVLADFLDREPTQWEPGGYQEARRRVPLPERRDWGGKAGLTPASRLRLKTRQSGKGESLTPLANNLTRRIQPRGDHVIGESFICEEDDFGADHITVTYIFLLLIPASVALRWKDSC